MQTSKRVVWEAALEQPRQSLLDLSLYGGIVVGYLVAIFASAKLDVLNFALLTLANIAWLLLYRHIQRSDSVKLWYAVAFIVIMGGTLSLIKLGVGFDWLMPTVSVGILAALYPFRISLVAVLCVWFVATFLPFLLFGRIDVSTQLTLLPPFIFAYGYVYTIRYLEQERHRSRTLLTSLEHSNAELERAHQQLQSYAQQVEELAATRERTRIAREIHDTLGHYLSLLSVQLETAVKLEELGEAGLHHELLEARRVSKECLLEVRRAVATLRPVSVTALDVALQQLVAEFGQVCKGTEVVLDIEGDTQPLEAELRMMLYRCAQEALTNVRKHAQATRVLLRLIIEEKQVELTVLDNGSGARQTEEQVAGFGLLGMRERVALFGGTLRSGVEVKGGWRVEVLVPRPEVFEQGVERSSRL